MTTILFNLLKETFLALIAKIAFRTIAERFMTRLVIYGLRKLKDYSTNDVVDDTVQDIIDQLKGKRLKVADDE
jgi:hypothetical protein